MGKLKAEGRSNKTDIKCPACGKYLRLKSPCCSDPRWYLACACGYKEVRDEEAMENGNINA